MPSAPGSSEEPIPWDSPSRFGAVGRFARNALRRALRPVEVRQRAREQRLHDELTALRAEVALLEQRQTLGAAVSGGQIGWATGQVGRRLDTLEHQAATVGTLVQPGLGEATLRPGTRVTERPADGRGVGAVCSYATGPYLELLGIAAEGLRSYAKRWGWDLVLSTEPELAHGRPAPWGKVTLVRELLESYAWVLWVDADAGFVRTDVDLIGLTDRAHDLYLVEHAWGDPLQRTANSGVFLLRSSDWARTLLDEMWAAEDLIEHGWWENAALLRLLGYELDPAGLIDPTVRMERVAFLDKGWNSVRADPAEDPIIGHHGGGIGVAELRTRMLDDLAALRRNQLVEATGRVEDAPALIGSIRLRERLPDALNALGLIGTGAEIGVRKGEYSELLLSRWAGRELISIDPWLPEDDTTYRDISNVSTLEHEAFRAEAEGRLASFGDRSRVWRLTSLEAAAHVAEASLDFAYIDARHDAPAVTEDIQLWWPKIRAGGVLAGHDYLDGDLPAGLFGVKTAVDGFFGALGVSVHSTKGDNPWPSWVVRKPG